MSLFKSFESVVDNPADSIGKPAQFTTIEGTTSSIVDKLKNIESLSEEEIINLILKQHKDILDYDLFKSSQENRKIAQNLFKNKKFLNCLIHCIINNWIIYSEHEVICCNKMAYDYMSADTEGLKDSDILELLLELSRRINYKQISVLSSVVPIGISSNIALMYKSSYKEDVCIHRVNDYIIRSGMHLDLNILVTIYSKLFHKMTVFFCETMLEMPESYYTEENMKIYDLISQALLYMLDTMPSVDITKVLTNYAAMYDIKGRPRVRFSMRKIEGYDRISYIIRNLIDEDGVIVP